MALGAVSCCTSTCGGVELKGWSGGGVEWWRKEKNKRRRDDITHDHRDTKKVDQYLLNDLLYM